MTFDEIPGARDRIRNALKALVDASGLSQTKFAIKYGFSQHQVNAWLDEDLRTTPSFVNLEKIAELSRTPWQWLLVGNDGLAEIEAYRKGIAAVREMSALEQPPKKTVPGSPGDVRSPRRRVAR